MGNGTLRLLEVAGFPVDDNSQARLLQENFKISLKFFPRLPITDLTAVDDVSNK